VELVEHAVSGYHRTMIWTDCPLVETHPRKQGGAPLIKNTRVPVSAILNNHDGGSSDQEIAENFGLAVEQVRAILEFADGLEDPAGHIHGSGRVCD